MNIHALFDQSKPPVTRVRDFKKDPFTTADVDLYEQYYNAEAREFFWAFRRMMDPNMILGWFPRDIADELQEFYVALEAKQRPALIIEAPPQHGKSRGLQDFIGWVAGKNPDIRTMYASYSDDLGVSANRFLQRMFDSPRYKAIFPHTRIGGDNVVTQAGRPQRNSSLIEYVGKKGLFTNTTVNGQVTGKGLDFGVIDDPIKGRAEAMSKLIRDKVWMWLMDDYFSRFSDHAGIIMIMTRWHKDDPVARFKEVFPHCTVINYPALATQDGMYRRKDDPLFPEFKSKEFLMIRKKAYSRASWESLYQQNPIVAGGGLFPVDKFVPIEAKSFDRTEVKRSVRYWDKAGTADGGAYTAGVLMHLMKDGRIVIEDCVRGQWNAFDREARILSTAKFDATLGRTEVWLEQEPGSGGKESVERSIVNLRGFIAKADKVTGSKETRAEPYAAQVQGGNVHIITDKGDWARDFLDEHESFPTGKYKDQVDAAAGAFVKLVENAIRYDTSMNWVGNVNG
jgi:predicted phage terminase large subunit-like protein